MQSNPERIGVAREQLGRAIRGRRESLEMPLGQLSTLAGLSPFTVNAIERGLRGPSLESLLALADALELSVRDLIEGVHPWDNVPAPDSDLDNAGS